MARYFITGIDTNVGKTFVSAVLAEALQADYWKPVQCGTGEGTDVKTVKDLISNPKTKIHSERYSFAAPVSPHLAAAIEGTKIDVGSITMPSTTNHLLIEGAGGLLVPLTEASYVVQLATQLNAEVILVVRNYVGCINHSLLSIEYLLRNRYKVKGMILNGNFDPLVEKAITRYSDVPVLAKFSEVGSIDKNVVTSFAATVNINLFI